MTSKAATERSRHQIGCFTRERLGEDLQPQRQKFGMQTQWQGQRPPALWLAAAEQGECWRVDVALTFENTGQVGGAVTVAWDQ